MTDKNLPIEERKQKLNNKILTWLCIKDSHGGTWEGVAEFFNMTRDDVVQYSIYDIRQTAESLGFKFSEEGM